MQFFSAATRNEPFKLSKSIFDRREYEVCFSPTITVVCDIPFEIIALNRSLSETATIFVVLLQSDFLTLAQFSHYSHLLLVRI